VASEMDPKAIIRIRNAVAQLAEREYPRVWIGEPGMTPEELLAIQYTNEELRRELWEQMSQQERKEAWEEALGQIPDETRGQPPAQWEELPEQLRENIRHPLEVDPGEFVEVEDTGKGLRTPKVSYEYLDGLWVLENMRHALDEGTEAELDREVLYISAAKEGKVPIIEDSWERYEAGIPPNIRLVLVDDLTPEDLENVRFEGLQFYVEDPEGMGPHIIVNSEEAQRALARRLDG
jgi:hypothetical protein